MGFKTIILADTLNLEESGTNSNVRAVKFNRVSDVIKYNVLGNTQTDPGVSKVTS